MNQPTGEGPRYQHDSFAVPLSDTVQGALSFETYGNTQRIDGVSVTSLKKHRGENGWFAELFRLTDGEVPLAGASLPLRQLSAAHAAPHRLNAFHIHPKERQNEIWIVLQGVLMIWLVDCRAGSSTEGARLRVVLSGEELAQLYIPAGVAHGYRAGGEGALLIYGMDQQFNVSDPNEGRLPWDHFGADLWAEDRG